VGDSPLLVCEECVFLKPAVDPGVDRETVVGTGRLELTDLGDDVKLLK